MHMKRAFPVVGGLLHEYLQILEADGADGMNYLNGP
jgi:hypothetical protein